jgi:trehalose 6-phosphate synthase
MARIVHISNRVEIPDIGKATAGGLDEVIAHTPDGIEAVRIGWSGSYCETIEEIESGLQITVRGNTKYITFSLPKPLFNDFYGSVSNGFLWPLFHHRTEIAKQGFDRNALKAYDEVNAIFAKIAIKHLEDKDTVLVHDYQLLKVGENLRKLGITHPLGFFLHIPTPSNDILEDLDYEQQQVVHGYLQSLYQYDLVGCQSRRDLINLKLILDDSGETNVPRIFETDKWKNGMVPGVTTHFGAFPVAGNNKLYKAQSEIWHHHPDTLEFIHNFAPNGVVGALGVDRLDYTKGLVSKAHAVQRWLRDFAKKGETLNLLQIAPFGRETVRAYIEEKARVETAFEGLSTVFNDPAVLHMEKVLRNVILGMSRQAEMILITPIRDGFNLVATETMVAKDPKNPAVTVLSKFTGAAGVLKGSCILVDSTRPSDIARGIEAAKRMPIQERIDMHGKGMEILEDHTSERWLKAIMGSIEGAAAPRHG